MSRKSICRLVIGVAVFSYLIAVAMAVVISQGLFGTVADPFGGLPLILLGVPWTLFVTPLMLMNLPGLIGDIVIVLGPLVNIAIIYWVCYRSNP